MNLIDASSRLRFTALDLIAELQPNEIFRATEILSQIQLSQLFNLKSEFSVINELDSLLRTVFLFEVTNERQRARVDTLLLSGRARSVWFSSNQIVDRTSLLHCWQNHGLVEDKRSFVLCLSECRLSKHFFKFSCHSRWSIRKWTLRFFDLHFRLTAQFSIGRVDERDQLDREETATFSDVNERISNFFLDFVRRKWNFLDDWLSGKFSFFAAKRKNVKLQWTFSQTNFSLLSFRYFCTDKIVEHRYLNEKIRLKFIFPIERRSLTTKIFSAKVLLAPTIFRRFRWISSR